MEELFILLGIVLAFAFLIFPFVAFGLSISTRKRLRKLEVEVDSRKDELHYLYRHLRALESKQAKAEPKAERAEPETHETVRPTEATPEPSTVGDEDVTKPSPPARDSATAEQQPPRAPEQEAGEEAAARPSFEPRASKPREAPEAPDLPPAPRVPLEQRLAAWFTRIGAGALLLGVLYFFKYAVDNEWIGPMGRVLVGAVAGLAILVFAEIVRAKTRPAYVNALVGVGLACLFISSYASSVFYDLVPRDLAFGANAIILLLGATLAWRYRGEAILILVLLAGFLNPVLLSTGVDRPFALFLYLFVLTSVASFVSVLREFRWTLIFRMVGVAVLFGGWYDKFFIDSPLDEPDGPYHSLFDRAAPLTFAALFTIEWCVTALILRQRELLKGWPQPLALAGLTLGHAGLCALLFDRAPALGIAMLVLGAFSVFLGRALDCVRFLMIPMLAAFAMLLGLSQEARGTEQTILLGLLAVWATIYVVAFLRDASSRWEEIPKSTAIRAAIPIAAFGVLSAAMLLPTDRAHLFGITLILVGAAAAVLADRSRIETMLFLFLVGSALPMLGAAASAMSISDEFWDPSMIAIGFAWSAIYVVAVMAPFLRGRSFTLLSLATVSAASLGWLGIALISSKSEAPTLRALLTGSTGVIDLGLAVAISRRRPEHTTWVTVLAAQSLGLFVSAVAFGLSGATVTVLWAVFAGVAVLIFADTRSPVWLVTATLLIIATVIRVLAVDVLGAEEATRQFVWSDGRSGVLAHPAFFNARAYAFLGTGLAFLGAAFYVGHASDRTFTGTGVSARWLQVTAAVTATLAYALLTTLAVTEIRAALLDLPEVPPVLLDNEEFSVFMDGVREAQYAQRSLLAMSTTLVLAIVGILLLGGGFAAKDPFHRYLGLTVLLGTIGKLVFSDVWYLDRIYQVVVFIFVGAILLGAGFLYARLKALFRGDGVSTASWLAFVATSGAVLILSTGTARAQEEDTPAPVRRVEAHRFQKVRPILGVNAPGYYRFVVDPELYRASQGRTLFDDLRIGDSEDREVPFVARDVGGENHLDVRDGRMLDPGEIPGGGFRATFELPERFEHCHVTLELGSGTDFLQSTIVETGESLADMQVVRRGVRVYSVDVNGRWAASSVIDYPPSIARYVRVTLLPDAEAVVTRINGARFSCNQSHTPPPRDSIPLKILSKEHDAEAKTTTLYLDAEHEGVPVDTLDLSVRTPEFQRRVEISASSYQKAWPWTGAGLIYRIGDDTGPASLRLTFPPARKRYFKLTIYDKDNAPLEIDAITASLSVAEVIFRIDHPTTGAQIFVGNAEDGGPSYDLAGILARRKKSVSFIEAKLGAMAPNPRLGKPAVAPELPATERHRTLIGAILAVLLVGLAAWAVRLIRGARKD